ncbi:MAG: four helix bundle protein [Burkholderiales bacterium]|nr:four helix bundle protein [Burkholderiales bacterium]
MATVERFEDLEIWQKGREVAARLYAITRRAPFSRDFALCDQLRRAAISIPSNMAEGFERGGRSEQEFRELAGQIDITSKMIGNLMRYLGQTDIRGTKFRRGAEGEKEGAKRPTRNPKPETRNPKPKP